jgi:hypothetical protein
LHTGYSFKNNFTISKSYRILEKLMTDNIDG